MNVPNRGPFVDKLADSPPELTVRVVTAVAMPPDRKARLENVLRTVYGRSGEIVYAVDPTLIGGVFLEVGDLVVDNSMRRQLENAGRALMHPALRDGLTEAGELS